MDLTLKEMDDLEVWSGDQRYQYHLGTCWTYRLSGSFAEPILYKTEKQDSKNQKSDLKYFVSWNKAHLHLKD